MIVIEVEVIVVVREIGLTNTRRGGENGVKPEKMFLRLRIEEMGNKRRGEKDILVNILL